MHKQGIIWSLVALLAAAVLVLLATQRERFLSPPVAETAALDAHCDLNQSACTVALPKGGQLTFAIQPRPVPVARPLKLSVTLKGRQANTVEVDFVGLNMNMGFNRPRLERRQEGVFAGPGELAVCTRRKMDWEARVLLHTDDGIVMAPFRFSTLRR